MRISDWSSDVCSSDLIDPRDTDDRHEVYRPDPDPPSAPVSPLPTIHVPPPSVAQVEYALTMRAMAMLAPPIGRSEEHTSELQSLMRISYAVFCLKKKITTTNIILHVYQFSINDNRHINRT